MRPPVQPLRETAPVNRTRSATPSPSLPTRLTAPDPAPAPSTTAEACPLTPAPSPPAPAATDGTATTRAEFPASPPAPAATDSPSTTRADSTAPPPALDATNASPQTRAEPPASLPAPVVSAPVAEVSWAFRFAQIGGGIEDCGTYLGAWETSLRERSQFFLWVSGYVPEGEFPEIVLWMARACRGMSQVLGQLARMAKGASGLCRLVGGEIKRLAQGYVQGTVDGDIENPDSAPRFNCDHLAYSAPAGGRHQQRFVDTSANRCGSCHDSQLSQDML
ncbi:phosphatidylinositol transfer protein SFH5-like [Triticum urartu]|uniref:phosphatidylinositol transfer protein SFH5-like n=1 Tax=Triticum urartu TaxID=4572 RepID=UPI002043B8C6|nr:phosphatidylinositol transfer protein SFH5-like [Triticum urartu]